MENTKPSFLSLPPEIRLQIYTHLLLPSSPSISPPPKVHTAILLANRQIYSEAFPLLYTKNIFLAHQSLLTAFPRLRTYYTPVKDPVPISLIRKVRLVIRLDCDARFERATATKMLSNLDEVIVDVAQAMFLGAGYENLRRLEGVRGVGRVVIRGSTTGFEDYVRWLRGRMESVDQGGGCVFDGMDLDVSG